MSDWPRIVNLRRCARGFIDDQGEDTNTTVALTNNTSSGELLLIWQMQVLGSSTNQYQVSYQQNLRFTPGGVIAALVPGDAPPPGVLVSGDTPVPFAFDYEVATDRAGVNWPATFPFAVLQPNWSLVLQNSGGGIDEIAAAFWWEAILPKYFDRFHTHQYLEIMLASQGG